MKSCLFNHKEQEEVAPCPLRGLLPKGGLIFHMNNSFLIFHMNNSFLKNRGLIPPKREMGGKIL
jgi:hypothetical protein